MIYTYFALKFVSLLEYVLTTVRELMMYFGSSWCIFFKVSLKTDRCFRRWIFFKKNNCEQVNFKEGMHSFQCQELPRIWHYPVMRCTRFRICCGVLLPYCQSRRWHPLWTILKKKRERCLPHACVTRPPTKAQSVMTEPLLEEPWRPCSVTFLPRFAGARTTFSNMP